MANLWMDEGHIALWVWGCGMDGVYLDEWFLSDSSESLWTMSCNGVATTGA